MKETLEGIKEGDVTLPLVLAHVSAGFPTMTEEGVEGELNINDLIIKNPISTFFVRVSGESMRDAGIHSGDVLVVDRSLAPENGRVVIAIINGELTVKRLNMQSGKCFLASENSAYPSIPVTKEDAFTVWGVVTYVVHKVT